MRNVCCEKAAFFKFFGLHLDLDFAFGKFVWTVVGLGLSFKKSGLDLDRKIWQSAHLYPTATLLQPYGWKHPSSSIEHIDSYVVLSKFPTTNTQFSLCFSKTCLVWNTAFPFLKIWLYATAFPFKFIYLTVSFNKIFNQRLPSVRLHRTHWLCKNQRWAWIRIDLDWIRTEANFDRIMTGSDFIFLKLAVQDWIGLRKFLLF